MRAHSLCTGCLLGLFAFASVVQGGELIEGSDARAKPFKEAVAALSKEIGTGSLEKAKAVYAGDGADLELLKAYVDGVAAAKNFRAAVDSKFGDDPKRIYPTLDVRISRMSVSDFNTVFFYDEPDAAASSANSPLGVGIEFKRVKGVWQVRSLASKPNTPQEHIGRLAAYTRSLTTITEKTKSGGYASVDEAITAAGTAFALMERGEKRK
jgi:hypothetical protein